MQQSSNKRKVDIIIGPSQETREIQINNLTVHRNQKKKNKSNPKSEMKGNNKNQSRI